MYLLPYLPEASVILGWFCFLQNLLQFPFSRCFPSEESAWTALCWHQGKRTPWNYASELTEQELETSLTFRETSAAPDTPPNPPAIHQPPSPEQHRRRCNHPLCMEQHAQRRRWWSLFSPPLLLPALISEEVDVVDQTAVGCVGRSEDGLPSVLWSVSHPKQEIGLYY